MLDRISVPIKASPSIRKKGAPLLRLGRLLWIVVIRGPVRGLAVFCLIVLMVVVPGVAVTLVSWSLPGGQGTAAGVAFGILLGLAAGWLYLRSRPAYTGRSTLPMLVLAAADRRQSNAPILVVLVTGAALLGNALTSVRRLTADALGYTGQAGIPLLLHAVEDRTSARAALSNLARMGSTAAPAVDYLLQHAYEWNLRGDDRMDLVLVKIGAPAVPGLLAALKSPDPSLRSWASQVLAKMPPLPTEAAIPLAEGLLSQDWKIDIYVQRALRRMGPRAAPALPLLLHMLQQNQKQRWDSAEVLQTIGPAAAEAVPTLIQLLLIEVPAGFSPDPPYAEALGGIGSAAVTPLRNVLRMPNDWLAKCRALRALGLMGPAAKDALPEIRPLLHSNDISQWGAAEAWTRIGGDPSSSLPIFLSNLRAGKDPSFRVLEDLGPLAVSALPDYVRLLHDRRDEQRARAASLIASLKEKGAPAVEDLAERVRHDPSPQVRARAIEALRRIGLAAAGTVTDIQGAVKGLDERDQLDAALAVCELGRNAQPLADWLQQKLADESCYSRDFPWQKFQKVARELGPEARPLVPVLETAYREKVILSSDLIRILYPIDPLHAFLHDDDAQASAFGILLLVCLLVETLVFRWRWTRRRPLPVRVGALAPLPRTEGGDENPLAGL